MTIMKLCYVFSKILEKCQYFLNFTQGASVNITKKKIDSILKYLKHITISLLIRIIICHYFISIYLSFYKTLNNKYCQYFLFTMNIVRIYLMLIQCVKYTIDKKSEYPELPT